MRHKHYNEIVAWAEGAKIEYYEKTFDDWLIVHQPTWHPNIKYRIKETKKYQVLYCNRHGHYYTTGICYETLDEFYKEHPGIEKAMLLINTL